MNAPAQDSERTTEPVFLGLTRPTMVWGVPQDYFVLAIVISMLGFVFTHQFRALLAFPVLYGAGYLLALRDARIFDILLTKAKLTRGSLATPWGARSYDPFR